MFKPKNIFQNCVNSVSADVFNLDKAGKLNDFKAIWPIEDYQNWGVLSLWLFKALCMLE